MFKFSTARQSVWRTVLLSLWFLALPVVGLSPFYYVTAGAPGGVAGECLADRPGVEVSNSGRKENNDKDDKDDKNRDKSVRESRSKSHSTTRNDITLWLVANPATIVASPAPAKRQTQKSAFGFGSAGAAVGSAVTQATLRLAASRFSESGKAREGTLLGHKPSGLG